MKVVAPAGDLARALSLVALGVAKRSPAASIGAVHIATANGQIQLASTFLELAVAAKAIATIVEPGSAATAAVPLINLICSLPSGAPVAIAATENWVSVSCGHHRSRLAVMPWAELPSMIGADDEIGCIEVTGADCLILLEPLPAAESERARYYLGGIHWRSAEGRLVACATNGVKLILTSVAVNTFSEGLILPRESATVLQRLIRNTKPETVTLRCSTRLVAVTCASFSFVSKLIDAEYPNIKPVIPPPSANAATCKRDHLIHALESLDAVARMTDEAPLLALHFEATPKLHLGLAREMENGFDIIEADTTGTGRAVIQLRLFLEMLNQVSGEKVRIETNAGRPLRMFGVGDKLVLLSQCRWDF